MEGTMDMTSNASNSTAAASAPNNQIQEAVVSSPAKTEQAASKKPRAALRAGGSGEPKPRPQLDAALSCPRCCSTNTKFCYYNNYNLNQPRHFCKACRRYWTQGGSLRYIPVGGGFRRNKRATSGSSSSSSAAAASSTAATSAEVQITVATRLMVTTAAPTTSTTTMSTSSMPSPTPGSFPNDLLPTSTPTGGSGFDLDDLDLDLDLDIDLDLAMDDQQGLPPFSPLSLSDDGGPELVPGGSDDMTPSLLEMLTGWYSDAGSSSSYGAGLDMISDWNGMDMPPFLLPEMEAAPTTDPMQTQLMEEMDDVAGEPLWASSELDNYINDDGGYAAGTAAGVQQQQEEDNKAKESSKTNNDTASDGAEG